ncbi:hypothetical protein GCM10010276_32770 [Streptomyces longisporus]|uniref:Uncharacterized protein n=1 Tax=Streptomyces longisporus TaxID=1948 RepID=A0ABP5Z242_STRLO
MAEGFEELGLQLVQRRTHLAAPSPMQQHDPADRTSAHRIHPLIDNMRSILACDTVQTESAPEEGNRPNPAVVT